MSVYSPTLIADSSFKIVMSKKQTGLRIDRVLYGRFQQLCAVEKLRPGEAVELLVRLAVDAGSIAEVYAKAAKPGRAAQEIDDLLFRSGLSRLRASLEAERKYWMETGEEVEEPESEELVKELTDLARRSISGELVREFEASLREADKFYQEREKTTIEQWIKQHKTVRSETSRPSGVSYTSLRPNDT